ncbi:Rcvrn [Lemmus lemmus]
MGNSKSGALSKEILEDLQLNTKFTEEELSAWYQSFLKECPSGRITRQEFESIYSKFFPDSDPKAYAQHVFRSFDANSDGTLDFKEYVIALHMTTAGKPTQKLEWAFSLYDVDGNGAISKSEVLEIVMVSVSPSRCLCGMGSISVPAACVGWGGGHGVGWRPQMLRSPVEWGPGQESGERKGLQSTERNRGHSHSIICFPKNNPDVS